MVDEARKASFTGLGRTGLAYGLTVCLFLLWGVANNLNDILIAHFKTVFALSDFQAGLVQSAFYLGYFCLAMPAALVMRARGYRHAVLVGLTLYGVGALLFWPAAATLSYPFFLVALFVIAAGLAFLETSANPLVTRLGPPADAQRRLNFAQAFNPLGSIVGVLIGRSFILTPAPVGPGINIQAERLAQATSVQMPYLVIGLFVLLWAVIVRITPFPSVATQPDPVRHRPASFRSLLAQSRVRSGIVAQFFYVGAQVGIWSFLIRYAEVAMPGTSAQSAAIYLTASLVLFMLGRFLGAALMIRIQPLLLLTIFAAIDVILCLAAIERQGAMGIAALVLSSLFMSIMYPTIFAEAVEGLGEQAKSAAALLVMAIIGGAILPALMGLVSDQTGSIRYAMAVPALCFVVVLLFGLAAWRTTRTTQDV